MGFILGSSASELVLVITAVFTLIYFYVKHIYSYWERRGVESLRPTFPFGNFTKTFMQTASMAELTAELYESTDSPHIGFYGGLRPMLLIRDPNTVQRIFCKDFQHFQDRGLHTGPGYDPLSENLVNLSGEKWKNMRTRLSPTFTSGKLKAMFATMVGCGEPLQQYLEKCSEKQEPTEMREVAASFATNIIASVAFGIDINCIENPDLSFRKFGRKIFEQSINNSLRQLLGFISPKLMSTFKIRSIDKDVEDFMISLVKENLKFREEHKIIRKDFFQLLVQLRNSGEVGLDGQWDATINSSSKKSLTIEEVAAQSFVFYAAGFETSSTTVSFCLYELAKNQGIQKKVHEEIDTVLANNDGQLTYESISEMKYLEACIDG